MHYLFFCFLFCFTRRRILQSGDDFFLQAGQGGDETQCLSALHQLFLMLLQSTAYAIRCQYLHLRQAARQSG